MQCWYWSSQTALNKWSYFETNIAALTILASAYIYCPGSYLCGKVPGVNISRCVLMEDVCDGRMGCPGGDDETQCGRCTENICKCILMENVCDVRAGCPDCDDKTQCGRCTDNSGGKISARQCNGRIGIYCGDEETKYGRSHRKYL